MAGCRAREKEEHNVSVVFSVKEQEDLPGPGSQAPWSRAYVPPGTSHVPLANHYSSLCLSFPFSLMRGLSFPGIPIYFRLSPRNKRLSQGLKGGPRAVRSSPGVVPLEALSVGSPSTDRPGILFPSKVSIRQSPLLGAGGEGLRARPPLSKVKMSPTKVEGIRMGMGWGDGSGGLPRPARTPPLRGGGSS